MLVATRLNFAPTRATDTNTVLVPLGARLRACFIPILSLSIFYLILGSKEAKMIEEIFEHASPKMVAVAVVAILILVLVTQYITTEWKIRSLGGHAHRVKTWLPLGISPLVLQRSTNSILYRYRPRRPSHQWYNVPQEPRGLGPLLHSPQRTPLYR